MFCLWMWIMWYSGLMWSLFSRPATPVLPRDSTTFTTKHPSVLQRGLGQRMSVVHNSNGFQFEVGQGGPGRPVTLQHSAVATEQRSPSSFSLYNRRVSVQDSPSSFSLYDRRVSVQDLPPPYDARMRAEAKLHLSKVWYFLLLSVCLSFRSSTV